MKRWRLFALLAALIACLAGLCVYAAAYDITDVQPPAVARKIVYGQSGEGRDLVAYRFGNGENVLVVGFAIHGYEDNFDRDGGALVYTADQLMKRLNENRNLLTGYGWSVYVLPCMNPDGLMSGSTCNGPGRCTTTYIDANGNLVRGKGVDLNRSFPHNWTECTDSRNFNGTKPLAAREAAALAEFVRSVKGSGINICIDAHGWFQQTITSNGKDSRLFQIFASRFPNNSYANCTNSKGYFTSYTTSLGYTSCLFEFPRDVYSMSGFLDSGYCDSFNACVLDILKAYGSYNGHADVCPSAKFTDVDPWSWYHSALDYVIAEEIFNGVSDTRFAPDMTMTRAMFVTTLYRIANSASTESPEVLKEPMLYSDTGEAIGPAEPVVPEVPEAPDQPEDPETPDQPEDPETPGQPEDPQPEEFTDVVPGSWYEEAVNWAAEHEIVNGYPGGRFGPEDPLTREQLAAILYRYSVWRGQDVVGDASIDAFPDAGFVSSYALDAMRWAYGRGLVQGTSDGGTVRLSPGGTASRAQAAAILMRYAQGEEKNHALKHPIMIEPNIDENFGDLGGN